MLPGRAYPVNRPALAAVVDVLEQHGYDVRPVSWELEAIPEDPAAFVTARLVEAAPGGAHLVVGKSLGAWAAPYAAGRAMTAVWVTPVLGEPDVAAGIRANPAAQLVVAGLVDPLHDVQVAAGLGCDLVELDGVDHALSGTGDAVVAPAILERIADATDAFLRRQGWQD